MLLFKSGLSENQSNLYGINLFQIVLGILSLILGTVVYLTDRSPQSTYFVREWCSWMPLYDLLPDLFGALDRSLASFLHVFSFIMITAGLINPSSKGCLVVCLGWLTVDALFEAGQYFDEFAVTLVPAWFDSWPFLETCQEYFIQGHYDWVDMAAIWGGTLAAWIVLRITTKKRG